jgi:hypothetical protein
MRKLKQTFFLFLLSVAIQAQVKIGNNPTNIGASSSLELESTDKALVLTRVATTAAIINPVNGMIIYDLSSSCIKVYENGGWSDCVNSVTPTVAVTSCGFSGTYTTAALSGATFTATLTNNSFSSTAIAFQTSDLSLSGVSGFTVSGVSPSSLTLIAGQSATVTYTITGTTPNPGTLTGNWTKLSLSCSNTQAVTYSPTTTVAGPSGLANDQFHTVLLSSKGPYAANSISIYAASVLDGGIVLSGVLKEAELNTADVQVRSTAGVTTLGANHGSLADNAAHTVICPNNRVVTGFEVYASDYLDVYMKLQCTALNAGYATEVGTGAIDATGPSNSSDFQHHSVSCPGGQVIKGIHIYATSYLDGNIYLYCTPITTTP